MGSISFVALLLLHPYQLDCTLRVDQVHETMQRATVERDEAANPAAPSRFS